MEPFTIYTVISSAICAAFGIALIFKAATALRWRRRNLVRSGLSLHPVDQPPSLAGIVLVRIIGAGMVAVGVVIGGPALLGLGDWA
ncbi:hypothetical protein [uncultured Microbacterium sp.]|uniref:hypothetical protein n=1 Tax=uncultured Microbacterium sp. TaxID=191216 RepID=UPI0035CA01D4